VGAPATGSRVGEGGADEVSDVGKVESREGAADDDRREGGGTSMCSMMSVEAQGAKSGAGGRGGARKQNQGWGHRQCRQCQKVESRKGAAGEVGDAEK
jgi:hypothetical protein